MIGRYIITSRHAADNYAKKHVFRTIDSNAIFETSSFYLSDVNRYDLCVSSGAGCLLGCKICHSTYSHTDYERNLSYNEITDQIEFSIDNGRNFIDEDTMVVVGFMGNGDPFLNIEAVTKAISLSYRKYPRIITRFDVSTIGINLDSVQQLSDLSLNENIIIWLQYSVISMNEAVRQKILPSSASLNKAKPYLDWYASKTGYPIRYNFPMIKGVNDTIEHLDQIVRFIAAKPRLRMVKISTYNQIPSNQYSPCSDEILIKSADYLRNNGIKVDVFFANQDKELRGSCGQLRELSVMEKRPITTGSEFVQKLALFTRNPNKIAVAKAVASRYNIDISTITGLSTSFSDLVEQDGITYLDRALFKAKEGYKITSRPCVATDYGMEILSLNRKPDVTTEHWMNSMSDEELIKATATSIGKLPCSKRACEFVGVGVMMIDDLHYLYARDFDSGVLLTSPKGAIPHGHPLSSLLYIPEKRKTLAQMTLDEFPSKDVRILSKLFNDFCAVFSLPENTR